MFFSSYKLTVNKPYLNSMATVKNCIKVQSKFKRLRQFCSNLSHICIFRFKSTDEQTNTTTKSIFSASENFQNIFHFSSHECNVPKFWHNLLLFSTNLYIQNNIVYMIFIMTRNCRQKYLLL